MLTSILNTIFGCCHRRTTFPMTHRRRAQFTKSDEVAHVTCLDCGSEFEYDWKTMNIGAAIKTIPRETRRPEQSVGTGGARAVASKGAAGDLAASSN